MLSSQYKVKKNVEFVSCLSKSAYICRVKDYFEVIDFRHVDKKNEMKKLLQDKINFIRKRFGGFDIEQQLYMAFENLYKNKKFKDVDDIVRIVKSKNIAYIECFLRIQCINIVFQPYFFRVSPYLYRKGDNEGKS